jgi:cytochrome c-type biogenesis protein CcmE
MKRKHKRLTFVFVALILLTLATSLVLIAFEDNIVFFYSPTEILTKTEEPTQRIRLGGLVKDGSIKKSSSNEITFLVTDNKNTIEVKFYGILPDLFREGQGIVAEGKLNNGTFFAEEVLAKHDENYMPPEVAAAIKKSGQWQGQLK